MSRPITALLAAAFLIVATAPPTSATEGKDRSASGVEVPPVVHETSDIVPGEVVVRFRDAARGIALVQQRGLAWLDGAPPGDPARPAVLETRGRDEAGVLAELRADPAVLYAEPSYRVQLVTDGAVAAVAVNDPLTAGQYSLDRMGVRDAWSITRGGSGVVAVLDTGVQPDHPDLSGRVLPGRDFVNDDANAADDNGHGTWVAGIIAAKANDGYGIAGVSWTDRILPVKIMSSSGTGGTSDLVAGILWAADNGATVINMSVGGFPYSQAVQDAVTYAWDKGIVLVGAAGNNNREERFYPASLANVVSVSATQIDDEFSHWSSYGPAVDVSAPGSSVQTTNCIASACPNRGWGSHVYISGTSFATPNVAGVVALLRARFATESPAQIVARLIGSADDLGYAGFDVRYGNGRVNAYRAVGGSPAADVHLAGDAFEPNATLAAARTIALGTTVRPSIHPAGDVDVFAVDLARSGRLEVRVTGVVDLRDYPWNGSGLPVDPIVELYDSAGNLLQRVDAVWENGTELATVTVADATRVFVRIGNYFANGSRATYSITTTFVDEAPPRATKMRPAPGGTMVSPRSDVTFEMSEPVSGISTGSVSLRRPDGSVIPATVSYARSTGLVRVVPAAPLPSDTLIRLRLTSDIVDDAGLRLVATSYSFSTMPGTTLPDGTRATFAAGTHVGHRVGGGGAILGHRASTLGSASGAVVVQRAALPNLPGAWLYVENGTWAGHWVRESRVAAVAGTTEVTGLAPSTRIAFAAGTHVGRTFDALGRETARKSFRLMSASGANVDAVAVINGQRHYRVVNGVWAGYWVVESDRVHRAGFVDRVTLARRVQIAPGTHVGIAFDTAGTLLGRRTGTLDRVSGAPVSAWAIVNGEPYVLVSGGMWSGYWLPERVVVAYER